MIRPVSELVAAAEGRFTVLIDTLPNDLTPKADVVLPGTTFLEKEGTFTNSDRRIQRVRSAIEPIGANTALTSDDLWVSAFLPMNARIGSKITTSA